MDGSIGSERGWKHMNFAEKCVRRGGSGLLFLASGVFGSLILQSYMPNAYAVLLLLATGACGWIGRRTMGVTAGILATASVEYFFLSPPMSFRLNADQYPELAVFAIAAVGMGWLSGVWSVARSSLEESREQFRVLLDGVKDYAVFLLDEEGRVATWNTGAQRIDGYTAGEILGKTTDVFYSEEEVAMGKPKELLAQAADRGSKNIEGWRTRRDGTRFWAEVTITTLKEAEEKAQELNRALERQNADLTVAKALIEAQTQKIAIAAKMSALGEMAGGMAHEINNPMGIIHAPGQRSDGSGGGEGFGASKHGASDDGKDPEYGDTSDEDHDGAEEVRERNARRPGKGYGSPGDPGRNAALLHGKAETEFSGAASGPGGAIAAH